MLDGPDTGQFAEANGNGEYRFASLRISNVNFTATASGYLEDRRGTFVDGNNTLSFVLSPAPPPPPPPAPEPTLSITTRIVTGGPGTVQEWELVATSSPNFTSYDWDFGDGNSANNTRATERHVYRVRGNYTVTVIAKRSNGSSLTATLDITVE